MKPSPKSEEFTTFAINRSEPDISEFCSKQVISNAEATLLLIDPAEISRVSLVNLIGTHCPGISVEVAPKSEKISADSRPDVVLLDIKSAEIEGREVLQQIAQVRARFPNKPIVILSDCTSSGLAEAALRLGLSGCIPYSMGINTTYAAIRLVLLGGTFFPRESFNAPAR